MTSLRSRFSQWHAALLAAVLVALLIGRTSSAAFSAQTDNAGNSFATGTVQLSDDDGGAALFTVTDLVPGQSVSRCIDVTYTGSLDPLAVKVFAGGAVTDPDGLAASLDLVIQEGAAAQGVCDGTFAGATTYTGTVDAFDGLLAYGDGVGSWDPAGSGEARGYRITVTLDAGASDALQGASASDLALVWETRSS